VQRLRTQLDQYTDLGEPEKAQLETLLPTDDLRAFRSQYLETAKRLRDQQGKGQGTDGNVPGVEQLDFEFVLFASAVIDYDYIMGLMAASTAPGPKKQKMTREQIIGLLGSSANLMDEADDLTAYFAGLPTDRGFTETEIRAGFDAYKRPNRRCPGRHRHGARRGLGGPHGLRGRHPAPHDFRQRSPGRPAGPAGPGLENPRRQRKGADGRTDSPIEENAQGREISD
jgi:hypothetical protein